MKNNSIKSSKIIISQCLECKRYYKVVSAQGALSGISHGWCKSCIPIIQARFAKTRKRFEKRKLRNLLKENLIPRPEAVP